MFKGGDRIRHKNCLDVDIVVLKKVYKCRDYEKLRVLYWNRNWNIIIDPRPETVKIKTEDFDKWTFVKGELYE